MISGLLPLFSVLLDGLRVVHKLNMLHLDIKPANLMISLVMN
ncbi:protein containing Serine/threonine protein kinase-related domain [methanotrophic bacterial endosymbiont of Bathymodiolus sp.]|nr:protein containing Serine/threonine protein kinase-related domain [methanotrophic bacterial endosymbiont of Bathymodiolus sp.]